MALEVPEESYFDGAFEFDAPQWIDLGSERDHSENETDLDQYDWWFQKVHPLHSPDVEPEPQPKQRKRPLRRSVLSKEGSKLSTETTSKSSLTGKSSLPGHKSSLTRNSSFTSKSSSIDKSSLTDSSNPIQESDAKTSKADAINETNMTISKPGEAVKRPRKCWQLNGHNSSGTPKHLASLPLDLQPKRASSNSLSNRSSCTMLPERASTGYTASPLARGSPKKQGVKNRNLKAMRRSCPQKLEKSRKAWNENPAKNKKDDIEIDEELQKIIEEHNRKILSQRSQYDLNGRKIKKTESPLKPSRVKKENMKPAAEPTVDQTLDMDEEFQEMINNHNRRIWAAKNSEYDLNGRRIRKGNSTVVTPSTKTRSAAQSPPRRSGNPQRLCETNQKRKNPTKNSDVNFSLNKTDTATAASTSTESLTDFENEIQEIVDYHNARLAAKKAKK